MATVPSSEREAPPSDKPLTPQNPHPQDRKRRNLDVFDVLDDLKDRLVSVELLWVRMKQLQIKVDSLETTQLRLNARLSVALRRRHVTREVDVEEHDANLSPATVQDAEEIVKRQVLVQRHSALPPAPPTTTSPTSPEQSREN